jgi:hypothetical protein
MFVTAVKTAIVEALNAGFQQLASSPVNNSLDLVPNSITINYPLQVVQWPAILVQFRPGKVQWSGLQPDEYTAYNNGIVINGTTYPADTVTRTGYFEGSIDLQIMAMHSEERDRLWDSITNLILMNGGSPASSAFYSSIYNNDLVGMTLQPDTYTPLGDSITSGTPWSTDDITYEASVRINCIGDFYTSKYDYQVPQITEVVTSGTAYVPAELFYNSTKTTTS